MSGTSVYKKQIKINSQEQQKLKFKAEYTPQTISILPSQPISKTESRKVSLAIESSRAPYLNNTQTPNDESILPIINSPK